MVRIKSSNGFTILETIIVLAIGGLIILTTLYAVPTLQRNSRNTTRKNDVATILDKLASFQLNHSGAMPSASDNFLANTKLSYYDKGSVSYQNGIVSTYTTSITFVSSNGGIAGQHETNNDIEKIVIYNYRKCDSNANGAVSDAAGFRDVIALYGIETSSGGRSKCLQM